MNLDSLNSNVLTVAQSIGQLAKNLPTQITRVGNTMFIDTSADIVDADVKTTVDVLYVSGYTTAGDGGGGTYVRTTTTTGPGVFTSADGSSWVLFSTDGQVTPLQFGAVGDGTTDDATAWQNAIDFCIAGTVKLFVPAFGYLVATGLTTTGAITIDAESGAVLGASLAGSLITSTGDGLRIIGLGLQNTGVGSILTTSGANLLVSRCAFTGGINTTGITFTGGSAVQIQDNTFDAIGTCIAVALATLAEGLSITGNLCRTYGTVGLQMDRTASSLTNVIISNNVFSANGKPGVQITSATAWITNILVNGNEWSSASGSSTGFTIHACTNFQICNNVLTSVGSSVAVRANNTSSSGVIGPNSTSGTFTADVITATNVLFNVDVAYGVNGTKVIGPRITGWGAPTGALSRGTFDTAATLATTAQTLGALITDLRTHGLINT